MHAYWQGSGEEPLLLQLRPTIQGHKTAAFELRNHRFIPRITRFERLSDASSAAILQLVADTGSYHHRLTYTIKRLQDLTTSPVHAALLASLESQLSKLAAPDPQTILQYATGVQPYARKLYELCRVVGCDDLSSDISLESLPPVKVVLDRCFDMSWPLFLDCVEPWLRQLHRMIDIDDPTSSKLIWDHLKVYLPEMFCVKQNSRFCLVESLVPEFMPLKFAQMAVECLNCRRILEIGPENTPQTVPMTGKRRRKELSIDPFADTSQRRYTPEPILPNSRTDCSASIATARTYTSRYTTTNDKVFAVYEMLNPILAQHHLLTDGCRKRLRPLLRIHFRLIRDIFLLMNGTFWMICREEIAQFKYRPLRAQLEPMNRFIKQIAPPCIYLDLQMNENLVKCISDSVIVEYSPPKELEMIITKPLIEACNFAFSILLQLQQENRRSPLAIKELQLYYVMLQHQCIQLEVAIESEFTFDGIVREFDRFKNTLLDI